MTGGNKDFTLLKIYLFIWLHQVFIKVSGIFIASFGVFCHGTQLSCGLQQLWAPACAFLVVAGHGLSCSVICKILVP